mmetsp:Transcript_70674/g.127322  ORF Transcript_70674/g.127322 Transcript_70674/m.127322 type:complete len:208 (-) Transcript_70674:110-733(-)
MGLQHEVHLLGGKAHLIRAQHLELVDGREFVLIVHPVVTEVGREQAILEAVTRLRHSEPRVGVQQGFLGPFRTCRKALPRSTQSPVRDLTSLLRATREAIRAEDISTPGAAQHRHHVATFALRVFHNDGTAACCSHPMPQSIGARDSFEVLPEKQVGVHLSLATRPCRETTFGGLNMSFQSHVALSGRLLQNLLELGKPLLHQPLLF